jgi:hypothetical protein
VTSEGWNNPQFDESSVNWSPKKLRHFVAQAKNVSNKDRITSKLTNFHEGALLWPKQFVHGSCKKR